MWRPSPSWHYWWNVFEIAMRRRDSPFLSIFYPSLQYLPYCHLCIRNAAIKVSVCFFYFYFIFSTGFDFDLNLYVLLKKEDWSSTRHFVCSFPFFTFFYLLQVPRMASGDNKNAFRKIIFSLCWVCTWTFLNLFFFRGIHFDIAWTSLSSFSTSPRLSWAPSSSTEGGEEGKSALAPFFLLHRRVVKRERASARAPFFLQQRVVKRERARSPHFSSSSTEGGEERRSALAPSSSSSSSSSTERRAEVGGWWWARSS